MFSSLHTKPTHFRSYAPFSTHKADSLQILCPLPYTQSLLTSDHTSLSLHTKLTHFRSYAPFSTRKAYFRPYVQFFLYTKLTHFRSYVLFSIHKAYSLHILCPLLSTQEILQIICSLLYTQSLLTSDPESPSLHTKLTSHPMSHSLYTELTHFRSYVPFPPHKADSLQILYLLLTIKSLLTSDPPSQS